MFSRFLKPQIQGNGLGWLGWGLNFFFVFLCAFKGCMLARELGVGAFEGFRGKSPCGMLQLGRFAEPPGMTYALSTQKRKPQVVNAKPYEKALIE